MSCLLKTSPDIISLVYGVISGDVLFFKLIVFYTSDNKTVVVNVAGGEFVEKSFLYFSDLLSVFQYAAFYNAMCGKLACKRPCFRRQFAVFCRLLFL